MDTQEQPLPKDLKLVDRKPIGTDKGQLPNIFSKVIFAGGVLGSAFGSIIAHEATALLFNEHPTYPLKSRDGYLKAFLRAIYEPIDVKMWKSNAVRWATAIGGILLTGFVVRKIEEQTFKNRIDKTINVFKEHINDGGMNDKIPNSPPAVEAGREIPPLKDKMAVTGIQHEGTVVAQTQEKIPG